MPTSSLRVGEKMSLSLLLIPAKPWILTSRRIQYPNLTATPLNLQDRSMQRRPTAGHSHRLWWNPPNLLWRNTSHRSRQNMMTSMAPPINMIGGMTPTYPDSSIRRPSAILSMAATSYLRTQTPMAMVMRPSHERQTLTLSHHRIGNQNSDSPHR